MSIIENGHSFYILESNDLTHTVGHNKFWKSWLLESTESGLSFDTKRDITFPFVVKIHYGPIGKAGAVQYKGFAQKYSAETYIRGRLQDKVNKGYVPVGGGTNKLKAKPPTPKPKPSVDFDSDWDLA